jgi:hypothetical protein
MRRPPVAVLIVLLALLPAVRLLWLSRDNPHLGFYHDDGVYWVTAKSIAQGAGYRIVSLPGQPLQTKYPPLFSTLLAAAWKLNPAFPANLSVAVWLTWIALPLLILLSDRLMVQWKAGGWARLAVGVALALNPILAYFATVLMSEIWATCFLLAAVLLAGSDRKGWWVIPLAGLCAAAAYLTKTLLAPLLLSIPLALAFRRKWRESAICLACAAPPALAWHAWSAAHGRPLTDGTWLYYLDYLGFWSRNLSPALLPTMVYRNIQDLLTSGGNLLFLKLGDLPFLGLHLARLLTLVALAGIVRWARSSRRLEYPLFAAGQFAMLSIWFTANERFLVPILPLLLLGLWVELCHVGRIAQAAWRRPERSQRAAAVIAGAVLVCLPAAILLRNAAGVWQDLPRLADARRAAAARIRPVYDWIARNTPPGAAFFADRDTTLYLRTGRPAIAVRHPMRYFYAGDQASLLAAAGRLTEFAIEQRLDYLLLTPADFELDWLPAEQRREVRLAVARDARFRTVFDSPAGTIVKIESR